MSDTEPESLTAGDALSTAPLVSVVTSDVIASEDVPHDITMSSVDAVSCLVEPAALIVSCAPRQDLDTRTAEREGVMSDVVNQSMQSDKQANSEISKDDTMSCVTSRGNTKNDTVSCAVSRGDAKDDTQAGHSKLE